MLKFKCHACPKLNANIVVQTFFGLRKHFQNQFDFYFALSQIMVMIYTAQRNIKIKLV